MQKRPSLLLAKWIGTSLYYQKLVFFYLVPPLRFPVSGIGFESSEKSNKKKKSWRRMFLAMMRKINSRFVDRRWEKSLSHSSAQPPSLAALAMRWEKFAKINARRGVFLLLSRHSFPIWCASRCVCVLLSLLFCDVSPHESATRLRNASRRQCRNKIKENNLCPAGNKWKKLQKLKQKTK